MSTQFKSSPKHLPLITIATVLAAVISSSALAVQVNASGNLDLNSAGSPRLITDSCYAVNSVSAMGSSNFPVKFRLIKNETPVSADPDTTWFQANNGTFQFQPGGYQLIAVNTSPYRTVRIVMSLECM